MSFICTSPEGQEAIRLASSYADLADLSLAEKMRSIFNPDVVSAALTQVALRRKAVTKLGPIAEELFFTSPGLEQATRWEVAQWKAQRLIAMGAKTVDDLCCGIGIDALAFVHAGLQVRAYERDEMTAEIAQANLGRYGVEVICADVTDHLSQIEKHIEQGSAIYIDPARRHGGRRTWRLSEISPSWSFVQQIIDMADIWAIKLGPGMRYDEIPPACEARWVSHLGDLVEMSIWSHDRPDEDQSTHYRAVILPGECEVEGNPHGSCLPVGDLGRYIVEPDPAIIRAQAFDIFADKCWLLDRKIAYLACDEPIISPYGYSYRILDVFPYSEKKLKAWTKEADIGILEIKKRGIEADPAKLRQRFKLAGSQRATIIITPTRQGTKVLVVERVCSHSEMGD